MMFGLVTLLKRPDQYSKVLTDWSTEMVNASYKRDKYNMLLKKGAFSQIAVPNCTNMKLDY